MPAPARHRRPTPSASRRRACRPLPGRRHTGGRPFEISREEQALGDWHDAETGLFGPRAWARILAAESARHRRHGGAATVVVVELPAIEDAATARGSGADRRVQSRVASVLASMARTSDHVARIGSRRFAILLPETDEVAAVNFVERVRPPCDEALHSADPRDRCRFGWADAHGSRSLDEAVEVAISRLASDT